MSTAIYMAMMAAFNRLPIEEIDWKYVESEYKLIKDKKSNLSRSEREWIVKRWENKKPGIDYEVEK